MKKATLYILAVLMLSAASCQKEEITPSKPDLKPKPIECRKCVEGWDIAEPVPPTNP